MKLYIILKNLDSTLANALYANDTSIYYTDEFCHTDNNGHLKVFKTLGDASDEMEEFEIDGQIVELPLD